MKKIFCCLIIYIMTLNIVTFARSEVLTTYGGTFAPENSGFQTFLLEHPNVSIDWINIVYYSTSELSAAILTGELHTDFYRLGTNLFDWSILMQKGYCLDLSESEVLMNAVSQMHPNIAKQLTYDGRLYAIPEGVSFMYWQVAKDVWESVGLTDDDVPQSFPEFLDFLERWCERIDDNPEPNIRTYGDEDMTEATYLEWLATMLIREASMQKQYEGQPLRFDDKELLSLLQRAEKVSRRLYQLESSSGPYQLFEERPAFEWPRQAECVVYLRLNESQPKLIMASLDLWAIYPKTDYPDLCIDLLERNLLGYDPLRHPELFLYVDAQPLINPRYEEDVSYVWNEMESVKQYLQSNTLSLDERESLERKRTSYEYRLQQIELQKWVMSPEQMDDYQNAANRLYFSAPDIFVGSASSEVFETLVKRFGARNLSAQQFLQELDRIARMMEAEDQ